MPIKKIKEYRMIDAPWEPSMKQVVIGNKRINRRFDSIYGDFELEEFFYSATEEISFDYMYSNGKEWIDIKIHIENIFKDYKILFDIFGETRHKNLSEYELKPINFKDLKIMTTNWNLRNSEEIFEISGVTGTICTLSDMQIHISFYFQDLKIGAAI